MASLLRSGKFFRLFSNLTRSFDLNNSGRSNGESLVCARRGEWEIKIHRALSTAQLPLKNLNENAVQQPTISVEAGSIDIAIQKAETDAKKFGRIAKDDILHIIKAIEQQKTATIAQSLLLIRCCGNLVPEEPPASRTKLVQDIWKMLEGFGIPMDISHYNALLRVYLENEHSFDPMAFLQTLKQKQIQPNRVTYQRLLTSYCQRGNIEGASNILEIMKGQDLPIGELVFNSLVMGHATTGDMENAKGVMRVMSQAGLEPDSETYRALLCGYAKHGLSEEILSTLSECEKKKIFLYTRDLMEVLYNAAIHGHHELTDTLMERLQKGLGYNQDCVSFILRLINQKQEDHAFKLLLSMKLPLATEGRAASVGGFFIRHIVKSDCAPEKILSFCEHLVKSELNKRAYFRALEAANAYGKQKIAKAILKRIQVQKDSLHPKAFWPLLTSQSQVSGEQGVLDALRQMSVVQVTPNVDTISQRVLPYMATGNVRTLLKKLRSADVPSTVVAISLVAENLKRLDFSSAIDVASKLNVRFNKLAIHQAAATAYLDSSDSASLTKLILAMLPKYKEPTADNVRSDDAADMAGPILKEVFDRAPKPKLKIVEPLMKSMHETGLGIPLSVVQYIQENAADEMTESVAQLIVELGSGKLIPSDQNAYSESEIESNATYRLFGLIKSRKLDEALLEKQRLESQNVVISDALNVLLMDLFARNDRFEEAFEVYKLLISKNPEITITPAKLLDLASSLIKGERNDDALEVLGRVKAPAEMTEKTAHALEVNCWRMLNNAAMKGNVDLVQKLFECLEKSNLKITNFVAGPLVKVHLVREDIESALQAFLQCVETRKFTPLKSTLTARLIEMEDAQRLQQVMDASIKVHGEVNCLYDLVFAFLDCGRVRQAKKVLETPGLRARVDRIETVCKRYIEEKRITELENLVKITKDVYGIDRSAMYTHLLSGYISANDVTRASGLWTEMQEEGVHPSDAFLEKLGEFLQENNQPIPFTIPSKVKPSARNTEKDVTKESETQGKDSSDKLKFLSAIRDGDIDAALELRKSLEGKGEAVSHKKVWELIEAAVKAGRTTDATTLVLDQLKSSTYINSRIFRFVMKSFAAAGDYKTIRTIGEGLSEERKSLVSYENVYASAIAHDLDASVAYVDGLLNEAKTMNAKSNQDEEQLASLRIKFPRGGILSILEKHPTLLSKCQEIAFEYKKLGLFSPMNSLWCYHLNNGSIAEAASLWETLKTSPTAIGFQPVCRHIRQQLDLDLAQTLLGMLHSSATIKPSALGVAYSAWIDVLKTKNDLDAAVALLNKALSEGVDLTQVNASTLYALKEECEKAEKKFPFSLPKPSKKTVAQPEAD